MTPRAQAALAARSVQRAGSVTPESRRQERELVLLYQRDPSTRETVVETFRPLARGIAKRYHRGEEPLEDLEQVALLGLIKALERFDPDRGSPFVTYAIPTMAGEVRRHFRDTGWAVHVTRGAQEMAQKLAALERETGARISVEEAAERLGASVEDVVSARLAQRAMRADSLDRTRTGDDEDGPAVAHGETDPGYASVEQRATISRLTAELPVREREILALRYGCDLSQAEIGRKMGVSQMHVSRILRRVLTGLAEVDGAGVSPRA